jgi:hypothetical protein
MSRAERAASLTRKNSEAVRPKGKRATASDFGLTYRDKRSSLSGFIAFSLTIKMANVNALIVEYGLTKGSEFGRRNFSFLSVKNLKNEKFLNRLSRVRRPEGLEFHF